MPGNHSHSLTGSFHNVASASTMNVDIDKSGDQRFLLEMQRRKLAIIKGDIKSRADFEDLFPLNQNYTLGYDCIWRDDFLCENRELGHVS
jgi:hypothetical protein